MAHIRERTLRSEIKNQLSWSPAVALVGMRQTGKATLLRGIDIPLLIRTTFGFQIAITVDTGNTPSEKSLKSLSWFKKKFPKSIGVVVHRGDDVQLSPTGIIGIPQTWIS